VPFPFEEFVVRSSPSIAPNGLERDIYLVLDDFGRLGRAWRETDEAGASRPTLVRNLLEGQYENPVRIVAFNVAEGWCRDVTLDIADELRRRYVEYDEVPASILKFLETASRHWGSSYAKIPSLVAQGPFTGGINPVAYGTKWRPCGPSSPRGLRDWN
jgi:hypothetical protein